MTSEAPATALERAIAATNFRHDDESGLAKFNLLAFALLHQHGPALAAALRDAERYRWLRARWDANTDEDIEQHTAAMNASDPDAAIDAARGA